jgi:hypothetical protein
MPASSVASAMAPPERIDLLHQVTLADAADGRIAAHLPQRLDIVGEQQGASAHARSRERGFGAGMAAADDDYPVLRAKTHAAESTRFSRGARGASIATADAADIAHAAPYLKEAMLAVAQGNPVANAVTKPYGCAVKY